MRKLLILILLLSTIQLVSAADTETIDVDYDFWYEDSDDSCHLVLDVDNADWEESWDVGTAHSNRGKRRYEVDVEYTCPDCPDFPDDVICPQLPDIPACPQAVCEATQCPQVPTIPDFPEIPECPQPVCEATQCPTYNFQEMYDESKQNATKDILLGVGIGAAIVALVGYFLLQKQGINLGGGGSGGSSPRPPKQPPQSYYGGLPSQR